MRGKWEALFGRGEPPIHIVDETGRDVAMMPIRADGKHTEFAYLSAASPSMADGLERIRTITLRKGVTGAALDEIHEITVELLALAHPPNGEEL